jgi:hypothetical protein
MGFSLGQLPGGWLVAAGGSTDAGGAMAGTFEWVPGHAAWTSLPPMGTARAYPAAAVLSDGRMLVAGGFSGEAGDEQVLTSVEVLAADGSGWAALPSMATARWGAVAGRLPGGQVIVAGGMDDGNMVGHQQLASAELWDPATGAWVELPPMAQARYMAAGCVLPSGRFAVLGGYGFMNMNAEAFDRVSRAWQPLPRMPKYLVIVY